MPKKIKKTKMAEVITKKIQNKELKMRPKWYFIVGSIVSAIALVSAFVVLSFSFSAIPLFIRANNPFCNTPIIPFLRSFPWGYLLVSIIGISLGTVLLKKYDFSYRKNFKLILLVLFLSAILSSVLVDLFDINVRLFPRYFKRHRGIMIEQQVKGKASPTKTIQPVNKNRFNIKAW